MSSTENAVSTMKLDRSRFVRVAVPTLGLFWLAVTTLPFIFVVMTSLKSQQETFTGSVWALPERLNFENYLAVLNGGFWTYLRNSVFVLVTSIITLGSTPKARVTRFLFCEKRASSVEMRPLSICSCSKE